VRRMERKSIGKQFVSMLKEPYYIYMLILIVFSIAVYVYVNFNPIYAMVASAVIYPAIALVPIVTYLPSLRRVGFDWADKFSVMIVFQWIGSIIWFIAEIVWCWYYNLYYGVENPYPSLADIFYVTAYFPVIIGLAIYVWALYTIVKPQLTTQAKIISAVVILGSGALVGIIYWYMILLSYAGEPIPFIEFMLNILYVLLDAMLLIVVVFGFIVIRGRMGRILTLFLVSSLMIIVYDVFFAYFEAYGLYYDGHPIELLDLLSYVVDALAFYEIRKMVR